MAQMNKEKTEVLSMTKNTTEKLSKMYGNVIWTDKPHNFFSLPLNFTRFILTDKKLIVRRGFLNILEDYVDLYKVIDTTISRPIGQRLFGCGTITVVSKDANNKHLDLTKVKEPHTTHHKIENAVEEQKKSYGILGKDMYGASKTADCNCEDNGDDDCCSDN